MRDRNEALPSVDLHYPVATKLRHIYHLANGSKMRDMANRSSLSEYESLSSVDAIQAGYCNLARYVVHVTAVPKGSEICVRLL